MLEDVESQLAIYTEDMTLGISNSAWQISTICCLGWSSAVRIISMRPYGWGEYSTSPGPRAARRAARAERRQPLPARRRRRRRRSPPRQRDLPRRRDRLAPARGVPPGRPGFTVGDVGSLNGTYVNRDRIDARRAQRRRRGPDRQVPPGVLRRPPGQLIRECRDVRGPSRGARCNIGEVLDQLRPDFPGVTIPKIRFLEDEGLVKPERTAVGLPQVLRRRRRAAALRPADAARPLPAAAR